MFRLRHNLFRGFPLCVSVGACPALLLSLPHRTVRDIIAHKGEVPEVTRKDKIEIDTELLHRIYNECDGWRERMHEKLKEEEGIKIGYSTLTRILR